MDTTETITHIGLCAGYGGIEMGLHRVIRNLRSVALCEIEAFACANLVSKMEAGLLDAAPVWTNLKTFPWADFRDRVDILTGGYPCQPFSAAGKRLGTDDPRHLWPFIADGIRILRPRLCFFENVEGHISLGLREVVGELESIGYKTAWGIFSASEVGAPHQRKRVFILAERVCNGGAAGLSRQIAGQEGIAGVVDYGCSKGMAESKQQGPQGSAGKSGYAGRLQCEAGRGGCDVWPSRPGEPQHGWEPPRIVAQRSEQSRTSAGRDGNIGGVCSCKAMGNAAQRESWESQAGDGREGFGGASAMGNANQLRPQGRDITGGMQGMAHSISESARANGQDHSGAIEPPLGGDADGPAGGLDYAELCVACDNRTDELRLLGNGVVPATAERAFRVLMEELFTMETQQNGR